MLYFVWQSLVDMLGVIRSQLNVSNLSVRLFQNDWEPSPGDEFGDYTPATFAGSGPLALNDFAAAFLNADVKAEIDAPEKIWIQTAAAPANTIYGYYVYNNQNLLVYAERNPAGGVLMNQAGLKYSVTPVITLTNEGPLAAAARQGIVPASRKIALATLKRGKG